MLLDVAFYVEQPRPYSGNQAIAETFRIILGDKVNSLKALVRRASIASNLQYYYDDLPAAVPPITTWPSTDREALQLWYQVAEDPEASAMQLHAAYKGICQAISDDQLTMIGGFAAPTFSGVDPRCAAALSASAAVSS